MATIPNTMRALQLREFAGVDYLELVEKDVPRPGPNEVLVKMAVAPVNPSDLMYIRGLYGFKAPLPSAVGFEGSGRVVAAGSGLMAQFMRGRRVACAVSGSGGTWAEYAVTSAQLCVPLLKAVTDEQGATLIVNPITAWALLTMARQGGHKTVVQTGAAGALGRMIERMGRKAGIAVINVVRRPEQVELLQSVGAKHVIDSSRPAWLKELRGLCRELNAKLAFDAVAGEMTGLVAGALERGGRIVVYGALSEQGCLLNPGDFVFGDKRVEGFWLPLWMRRQSLPGLLLAAYRVQKALVGELETEVQARFPLTEAIDGIRQYIANMTRGKVLIDLGAAQASERTAGDHG
jgi:NADPH2:quinone reductase